MERILSALARLNDAAAVNQLLAPMRNRATLKRKLRPGFCGHKYTYDLNARIARFLLTNGEIVACYSVTGVSLEEAKTIAIACEHLGEWSMRTFQAAVVSALGAEGRSAH
jgi:hypothetical protein